MVKKKNRKTVGIVGVILALGLLFFATSGEFFAVTDNTGDNIIVVESSTNTEVLEFCSTESQCISYLKNEGMPDNFVSENNIKINCLGGRCIATR